MTFNENFERFHYSNFEAGFLKNKKLFCKTGVPHFHTKLHFQKPMLRQIEWTAQNGPITKSGVLPLTTLFFLKI